MKERTETIKETVTKTETVYVAFDGTEFDNKRNCEEHEFDQRKIAFLHRDDIEVIYDAGPPCNGSSWLNEDENEYVWVKPNTSLAWMDMNETFNSGTYFKCKDTGVGKWTCIEFNYKNEPATYGFDGIIKAIQKQFAKLGYDVSFQKKA